MSDLVINDVAERLKSLAEKLMATTDFHGDAHTVLEAGITLMKAQDEIVALREQLKESDAKLKAARQEATAADDRFRLTRV